MKNFMKFAVPVTMALTLFAGATASADCRQALSQRISYLRDAGSGAIAGTGTTMFIGAGAPPVIIGGVTTAGAIAAVVEKRSNEAKKTIALINEAEVGDGVQLREIAAKYNVDISVLAKTISEANATKIFCPNADTVWLHNDILLFITKLAK